MKKLYFILLIISGIFAALSGFDVFKNPINAYAEKHPFFLYILLCVVCGSAFLTIYATVVNPQKKLDNALKGIDTHLSHTAIEIRKKWNAHDLKFNVMTTRQYLGIIKLYPKTSNGTLLNRLPSFFPRIFKSVWVAPEGHGLPEGFILGIRQGSSGKALSLRADQNDLLGVSDLPLYLLQEKDETFARETLLLNSKQFMALEGITVLFSVPIYKVFDGKTVAEIIGVLTVESRSAKLAKIIGADIALETSQDNHRQKTLKKSLCSTMMYLRDEYSRLYVKR